MILLCNIVIFISYIYVAYIFIALSDLVIPVLQFRKKSTKLVLNYNFELVFIFIFLVYI